MRRTFLAALVLLTVVSSASADYVLIVVNLNARPEGVEGGQPGNQTGGFGMVGIPPGGMGGGMGGIPPGGMGGGSPGGVRGGMGGMMPPGGVPGMPGAGTEDADDSPDLIVVVMEVKSAAKEYAAKFNKGLPITFTHPWGGKITLVNKAPQYEATLLEKTKNVPLASVSDRFAARFKEVFAGKDKPDLETVRKLALFALELGLVDECAKVMDAIAGSDKPTPALTAYLKVKAELARPMSKEDLASKWKTKLLGDYNIGQSDKHHFAILHPNTVSDVKPQLDRLEKTFRGFYYWWALRGVALPVAKDRQVAVLSEKDDLKKLQKNLTASPALVESFFARREGLSVVPRQRFDLVFDKIDKATKPLWDAGFERNLILREKVAKGSMPPKMPFEQTNGVRTIALLMKAMETEWEQTGLSHEGSRQMLYASKLLPRNVNAPEWVQFGMGSFFEAPLQSPWASMTAANPYWLPRFKELRKNKKYEPKAIDTLKKVVTDAYFREKPKGTKEEEIAKSREGNLRKARAASWSLTYFLARSEQQLPRLQRYFKELSKQPRDMELDEKALWTCFEKAFAGENLETLANRWISFIENEKLEASAIHEKIGEQFKKMNAPPPKTGGGIGGGSQPGFGGVRPPGQ